MHRLETTALGGNNEVNDTAGQCIVAGADLQTECTVDVFIEIAAVRVN